MQLAASYSGIDQIYTLVLHSMKAVNLLITSPFVASSEPLEASKVFRGDSTSSILKCFDMRTDGTVDPAG